MSRNCIRIHVLYYCSSTTTSSTTQYLHVLRCLCPQWVWLQFIREVELSCEVSLPWTVLHDICDMYLIMYWEAVCVTQWLQLEAMWKLVGGVEEAGGGGGMRRELTLYFLSRMTRWKMNKQRVSEWKKVWLKVSLHLVQESCVWRVNWWNLYSLQVPVNPHASQERSSSDSNTTCSQDDKNRHWCTGVWLWSNGW